MKGYQKHIRKKDQKMEVGKRRKNEMKDKYRELMKKDAAN